MAGPRYRLATRGPLRSVVFDDETVLFNPNSWDTHVLNDAAAATLEFVAESPRTQAEVAQFFAEALSPELAPEADEHAARVLDELCRLALLERDPDASVNVR